MKNPKFQYRNSKQYLNYNVPNTKPQYSHPTTNVLNIWILVIGICLEFRASDLEFIKRDKK